MSESEQATLAQEYPWPDFDYVIDPEKLEFLAKCIIKNKTWNSTEKIDGFHVTVSTDSWISTKHKRYDYASIPVNYHGATKRELQNLIDKLLLLKRCLSPTYNNPKVDFMAHGVVVGEGTSTTKHDIYDYKRRGYSKGDVLFFGLGIVLRGDLNTKESFLKMKSVSETLFFELSVHFSPLSDKQYLIVPLNEHVTYILEHQFLKTVPTFGCETLKDTLLNPRVTDPIKDRKIRGIVLSRNGKVMQLNYLQGPNIFIDNYFVLLEKKLELECTSASTWMAVFNSLKEIYQSSEKFVSCRDINDDFEIYIMSSISKFPEMAAELESLKEFPEARKVKIYQYTAKIMKDISLELMLKFNKRLEFSMDPTMQARFKKRVIKSIKGKNEG